MYHTKQSLGLVLLLMAHGGAHGALMQPMAHSMLSASLPTMSAVIRPVALYHSAQTAACSQLSANVLRAFSSTSSDASRSSSSTVNKNIRKVLYGTSALCLSVVGGLGAYLYHEHVCVPTASKKVDVSSLLSADEHKAITQTKSHYVFNEDSVHKLLDTLMPSRCPFISHIWGGYNAQAKQDKENIEATIKRIHEKEAQEISRGNYVMYHGQQWELAYYADLYRELWNVSHQDQMPADCIPLRVVNNELDPGQKASRAHWELVTGKPIYDLFYMNYALFAYTHEKTRCTLSYWLENRSLSAPAIKQRDIFKVFGLEQYYDAHAAEFENLKKVHASATNRGNLLLLSFDKQQAEDMVRLELSFVPEGTRTPKWSLFGFTSYRHVTKKDSTPTLINSLIHEATQQNSSIVKGREVDSIMFAMPLSPKVLHPKTGPRIYSYNTADPAVMAKYHEQKTHLFAPIKQNIK